MRRRDFVRGVASSGRSRRTLNNYQLSAAANIAKLPERLRR